MPWRRCWRSAWLRVCGRGWCRRRWLRAQVYVEPLREELLDAVLADLHPRSGEVPFYSTVTGGLLDMAGLDGEYWYRNLREPV